MSIVNKKFLIAALGVPCMYALMIRFVFGVNEWQQIFAVMTLTFVFLLPIVMGALTLYFSSEANRKSWSYRIFAPWMPVFAFLVLTIISSWEGWACWLMVLPVFLLGSSIGGIIGERLRRPRAGRHLYVSLLCLLPIIISPLEHSAIFSPQLYEVHTYIDIDGSAQRIWENVTRVHEITVDEDEGWLSGILGLPRPIKAELDFEGVGASRMAIFTRGLMFHETVSVYQSNKKMKFSIEAYPHEISPLAMDEHIVIGGKYFDVLHGEYRLEKISAYRHRLHLFSQFRLNTNFNFYAGYWAKCIMQDVQNNILKIQKKRSEVIK